MYILHTKPHPPVVHGNQCAGELYLVLRAGALLSNDSGALVDDVEQHLGELGVLVEVHQVRQAVVHLEGDASSLQAANSKERGSLARRTFRFEGYNNRVEKQQLAHKTRRGVASLSQREEQATKYADTTKRKPNSDQNGCTGVFH